MDWVGPGALAQGWRGNYFRFEDVSGKMNLELQGGHAAEVQSVVNQKT